MVCARNYQARSQTTRQLQETAVLRGMSTHGLWTGPARRNLLVQVNTRMADNRARRHAPPRARLLMYSFAKLH